MTGRTPVLAACLLALGAPSYPARGHNPAPGEIAVAPDPTWIVEASVPEACVPGAGARAESELLLEDHQVHLGRSPVVQYWRRIRRLNGSTGVQEFSQPEIEFDPSFERLVLHHARIRRGHRQLDALDPTAVTVMQAESERDQRLYSGRLTAIVFLRDVRPGDELDFAWSIEGSNPLLDERWAGTFDLALDEPACSLRRFLLRPRSRPELRWRTHRARNEPRRIALGDSEALLWEVGDSLPPADEGDLPPGFDPYPALEVSEFSDWGDVARWADRLFRAAEGEPADLAPLVAELRRDASDPSAAALAAVRFVQDQIRYLGMEMGRNSHAPHSPAEVLAGRYGDCKDKALLLTLLLRALGHEAWPALVNSRLRAALEQRLPSPFAFDHAIVKARIAGVTRWIDPTVASQGGDLARLVAPSETWALPVAEDTAGLERIPAAPSTEPETEVLERWQLEGQQARLEIVASYRGRDADAMRADLALRSPDELAREYLNQYARYDSSIRVARPLEVEDRRLDNLLVTRESYHLPRFGRVARPALHAWLIEPEIRRPQTVLRTMPLGTAHPVWLRQTVALDSDRPLPPPPRGEVVEGPAFRFESRHAGQAASQEHRYELRSLADEVPPARTSDHLRAVDAVAPRLELPLEPELAPQPAEPGLGRPTLLLWATIATLTSLVLWLRGRRIRSS